MSLDSINSLRFCQSSEEINTKVGEGVALCIDNVSTLKALPLLSVVLTGSLSRGEASILQKKDELIFLSDMEFLVVVEDASDLPGKNKIIREIESTIEEQFMQKQMPCKVEFTLALPRYFRNARPSIFAYELKTHGKILYGRNVLEDMPEIVPSDIPHLDAFYLICNRIIEQLESFRMIESGLLKKDDHHFQYTLVKFYLDIATSLLLFEGKYAATYAERKNNLHHSAILKRLEIDNSDELIEKIGYWTSVKLNPLLELLSCVDKENALDDWRELASFVCAVWQYELKTLLNLETSAVDQLIDEFLRSDNLHATIIQWIKIMYRALKKQRVEDFFKGRYLSGHPRHMLYMEAALLYFSLAGLNLFSGIEKRVNSSFMPFKSKSTLNDVERIDEILRFWTTYFRNN